MQPLRTVSFLAVGTMLLQPGNGNDGALFLGCKCFGVWRCSYVGKIPQKKYVVKIGKTINVVQAKQQYITRFFGCTVNDLQNKKRDVWNLEYGWI